MAILSKASEIVTSGKGRREEECEYGAANDLMGSDI